MDTFGPTEDIDATISGEGASLERVLAVAAMHRIEPRMPDALEFAQRTQVLLLVHRPSGVPLDLSLAWPAVFDRSRAAGAGCRVGWCSDTGVLPGGPDHLQARRSQAH